MARVLVAVTGLLPSTALALWTKTSAIEGGAFFDEWDFFADGDPTHGYVAYQTRDAAAAQNLTVAEDGAPVFVGSQTAPGGPRASVRLASKKTYSNYVAVFDVAHAPTGCGSWPAFVARAEIAPVRSLSFRGDDASSSVARARS